MLHLFRPKPSPSQPARLFFTYIDNNGCPVLVNMDQVRCVHQRRDSDGIPCGSLFEFDDALLNVRNPFAQVCDDLERQGVTLG